MNRYPNDWNIIYFGDVILSARNGYGKRPQGTEDGPIVLRLADVANGYIDLSAPRRVAMDANEFSNYRLHKGNLLFIRVNGSRDMVARCIWVSQDYSDVSFNDHLIRVELSPSVHDKYLFYLFKDEYIRSRLLSFIPTAPGGQLTINQHALSNILIPLPPLDEQRKIAQILSTWDEAIALVDALIAALTERKKGLMQRLLTGEVRFPGFDDEWEEVRLGEVLEKAYRTIDVNPDEMYRQIGIRSHGKGIFHKEPVTGEEIGNKRIYWVEPGDFTFNIVFAWEGAVALVSEAEKGMCASHRFPMFVAEKDHCDPRFILRYFQTSRGIWDLGLASPGGAGRNRTLNQSDFLNLRLKLPLVKEQKLVADTIDTWEDAINEANSLRFALAEQKKGLMQRLLTGEVRVQV